jgi:hypothetical protein
MEQERMIECPGCLLRLPDRYLNPDDRFNASGECRELYYEITYYTLSKNDASFIHQHVVDAYAAQHAGGRTRTITTVFALIGLYLATEKGYTGKQVQQAHMKIAEVRKDWPRLEPPAQPAKLTVMDVLLADTDEKKDAMIRMWSESVWETWEHQHVWIRDTTRRMLYGPGT